MALLPGSAALLAPTGNEVRNFSVTAHTPAAAVRTNFAGGNLAVPVSGLKVGSRMRWRLNMTKTAAGVAASTFYIAFGLLGTVADTARVSFTKPAGTAAVDEATVIRVALFGVPAGLPLPALLRFSGAPRFFSLTSLQAPAGGRTGPRCLCRGRFHG